MKHLLAGVGLLPFLAVAAVADPQTCERDGCLRAVPLASVAEEKPYGLLLRAPEAGCRKVRYRVETADARLLGKTPVLTAGEVAVVRIGTGFHAGDHALIVRAEGCGVSPDLFRRVTLRKASPDHGWRAALAMAALVPRD
jgi:hypothetical protein